MKLFFKILFFILAIFCKNINESKVVVFDKVVSEKEFAIDNVESTNESDIISENDFGKSCKRESYLVDYKNLAKHFEVEAAKGDLPILKQWEVLCSRL
jgi:hypothetical protein